MTDKQTVKFGDICTEVKLTTKDPIGNGYERYIGLEHLDSGSLKIKRWGVIAEDRPSFTRVFKKGQILFGRRRAYLKKAGVAEFDGICSGDIIVMEAKSNSQLEGLLPFIIQSDGFWAWAVKNSAGGLSPRTKYKSLEPFEVHLPRDISSSEDILNKSEEIFDKSNLSYRCADTLFYNALKEIAGVNLNDPSEFISSNPLWKMMKVRDCMNICNNFRKPISEVERKSMQGTYSYYGPTGVLDYLDHYNFEGRYVLIGEDGDHFLKFRKMPMTQLIDGKFNVNNHAHALQGSGLVTTEWFYFYFLHTRIYKYLTRQGAGRYKLTKEALGSMEILVPPISEQHKLCEVFLKMQDSKLTLEKTVQQYFKLAQAMRNEILGV
jgi:hypothetical protein